jgi:uncharacterized protein YndB with AHSA1/START domain
LTNFQAYTTLK